MTGDRAYRGTRARSWPQRHHGGDVIHAGDDRPVFARRSPVRDPVRKPGRLVGGMRRRRRGEETVTSRKPVAFMVAIVLSVATLAMSAGAQGAVRVFVDGDQVLFDQTPITQGGRVLVPLRGIFEKMGAVVEWNAGTRTVRAARGTTLVELQIGSRIARVDRRAVTLDVPPMVLGGRTLVPLRFISESLGAAVDYRAESRTVLISTTGQAGAPPG